MSDARGRIFTASLLLPGLAALATGAQADTPPERGSLSLRWGEYRDGQPGWDRVTARSPQLQLTLPVAGNWSLEATAAADSVSGATPRLHTFRTGATPWMNDERRAGDVRVTRYRSGSSITVGAAWSNEYDYRSRAGSAEVRWWGEDANRTWIAGAAETRDSIDTQATGGRAIDRHRHTFEWMLGVNQVWTPRDLVQLTLTRSEGHGYYNDPYKDADRRPAERNTTTVAMRWNHAMLQGDAVLRSNLRWQRDSFGMRSTTVGTEWVQPWGAWTFTPGIRHYQQGAASFYFDPAPGSNGRADYEASLEAASRKPGFRSADARLSAYGAISLSLRIALALDPDTVMDVKFERYRQDAGLRLGGSGSPGLDSFRARFIQVGLTRAL